MHHILSRADIAYLGLPALLHLASCLRTGTAVRQQVSSRRRSAARRCNKACRRAGPRHSPFLTTGASAKAVCCSSFAALGSQTSFAMLPVFISASSDVGDYLRLAENLLDKFTHALLAEYELATQHYTSKFRREYSARLVEKSLLIHRGRGRYKLYHPLFREFLQETE